MNLLGLSARHETTTFASSWFAERHNSWWIWQLAFARIFGCCDGYGKKLYSRIMGVLPRSNRFGNVYRQHDSPPVACVKLENERMIEIFPSGTAAGSALCFIHSWDRDGLQVAINYAKLMYLMLEIQPHDRWRTRPLILLNNAKHATTTICTNNPRELHKAPGNNNGIYETDTNYIRLAATIHHVHAYASIASRTMQHKLRRDTPNPMGI